MNRFSALAVRWREEAQRLRTLEANGQAATLEQAAKDLEAESVRWRPTPEEPSEPVVQTWRERLWTVPAETRIGVHELAEALNKPKSWIYRRTGENAEDRLPHRKLGGELVFTAGEIRHWRRSHELICEAGPMESTPAERRLRAM